MAFNLKLIVNKSLTILDIYAHIFRILTYQDLLNFNHSLHDITVVNIFVNM